MLDRLGVGDALREIGGRHRSPDIWTSYGWARPREQGGEPPLDQGMNVRRAKLDPILRRAAEETTGVEVRRGFAVDEVRRDAAGRVAGVSGATRDGVRETLSARLVVAADGRSSKVAELAGLPMKERPHGRLDGFRLT